MTKICNPSLKYNNHFVLSNFLAKMLSWGTFFFAIKYKTDFGRLFCLLPEAAQMTQNKEKA